MRLPNLPRWIATTVVGLLLFARGLTSNTMDIVFLGVALTFAGVSGAFTCLVRSDHTAKKILEVVLTFGVFGAIFYGYFLTGSLLLAILTMFIIVLTLVGFFLSYVLPKTQSLINKV
ncbi:MAG: hypothetical protein QXP06_03810 [Candidatus Bathyarchaeia archaeon]